MRGSSGSSKKKKPAAKGSKNPAKARCEGYLKSLAKGKKKSSK
jgi:hypothetical protein